MFITIPYGNARGLTAEFKKENGRVVFKTARMKEFRLMKFRVKSGFVPISYNGCKWDMYILTEKEFNKLIINL